VLYAQHSARGITPLLSVVSITLFLLVLQLLDNLVDLLIKVTHLGQVVRQGVLGEEWVVAQLKPLMVLVHHKEWEKILVHKDHLEVVLQVVLVWDQVVQLLKVVLVQG